MSHFAALGLCMIERNGEVCLMVPENLDERNEFYRFKINMNQTDQKPGQSTEMMET